MASLEALLAANGDKSRADRASARGLARESMLEAEEAVQDEKVSSCNARATGHYRAHRRSE